MRSTYAIPAAIFSGSVVVAVAVFAGLRGRGDGGMAPAIPASSPAAAAPSVPLAPVASGAMLVPPPAGSAVGPAREAVRIELERLRPRYVAKCWAPSVAKAALPRTAEYSFQIAFDAEGHERARGISESDPTPARADVAACLRSADGAITIPAPGRSVTVTVPIKLP